MAWSNSVSITISHAKVPNTDQTNFPMLFTGVYTQLAGTAFGGAVTSSAGFDIIFASDSLGASPLAFERTNYVKQTGACEFWVKIPTLSHTTDTVIYILFGNSAITTDQQNASGTWSNAFGGVWHFGSPAAFNPNDATTTNVSTPTGLVAATGEIAGGTVFSNSATTYDRITSNSSFKPTAAITLEAWIKPASLVTWGKIIGLDYRGNGTWSNPFLSYALQWYSSSANLGFQLTSSAANGPAFQGAATIPTGSWTSVAACWDNVSQNVKLYVNGAVDGAGGTFAFSAIDYGTSLDLTLGARSPYSINNAESFNGTVDEIRVSSAARSADWLATEYNNQSSPATFYSTSLTTGSPGIVWGPFPTASSQPASILSSAAAGSFHQLLKAPATVGGAGLIVNPGLTGGMRG